MIHYDLLDTLGGSYAAAALWERIRYRCERGSGWWEATRQQMCEETRLTDRVLRRALDELRDAGLIESERITPFRPVLRWRVVWADEPAGQDVSDKSAITAEPVDDLTITQSDDLTISLSSETEVEVEPPSTPQAASEAEQEQLPLLSVVAEDPPPAGLEAEFDGFWRAYPRKIGKPKARRAYTAARKRASLDEIAAGLRAQLPDMRARDVGFIPHPTTWLNQDRWADDPAQAAQARTGPRNYDLDRIQARASGDGAPVVEGAAALAIRMLEGPR